MTVVIPDETAQFGYNKYFLGGKKVRHIAAPP